MAFDLPTALDKLNCRFGPKRPMLQGGGKFNGSRIAAGLVDEISQVVVPAMDGGADISGFFDVPGPPPNKAAAMLRAISHKLLPGGIQWLGYRMPGT